MSSESRYHVTYHETSYYIMHGDLKDTKACLIYFISESHSDWTVEHVLEITFKGENARFGS